MSPVYSTEKDTPCCSARGRTMLATSASSETMLHRPMSSDILPASIFDRSRMSLISVEQVLSARGESWPRSCFGCWR